jgi:hypothetical protein
LSVKIHIARTRGNSCGCGSGGRITLTFPIGVTPALIEECKKAGFADDPAQTKVGLLYIVRGPVIISGSLCLKNGHLVCRGNKADCETQVAESISILEDVFGKVMQQS